MSVKDKGGAKPVEELIATARRLAHLFEWAEKNDDSISGASIAAHELRDAVRAVDRLNGTACGCAFGHHICDGTATPWMTRPR